MGRAKIRLAGFFAHLKPGVSCSGGGAKKTAISQTDQRPGEGMALAPGFDYL
jgi:hypothetical protein